MDIKNSTYIYEYVNESSPDGTYIEKETLIDSLKIEKHEEVN